MSGKQQRIVDEVFQDVRRRDAGSAVNSCLRLARTLADPFGAAYFLFEQESTRKESIRQLMLDFPNLEREQVRAITEIEHQRYAVNRQVEEFEAESLGFGNERVLTIGASLFDSQIEKQIRAIEIQKLPEGLTPIDTAVFHKEALAARTSHIQLKSAIERLKERCLSTCFNYASRVEKQLDASKGNDSSLRAIENAVFSFLRATSTEAFDQLTSATGQLRSKGNESRSNGLLQIRRCLKSIADALQPAKPENADLSKDKYLNRLAFYLEQNSQQKGSKGLDHQALGKLLRQLNDRASKGVHANISAFEADQVLLGTMLFLHRLSHVTPPKR